jgi:glycosidase/MoaA/NifB/PqqE/SkfB family radical SAM enzyme
VTLRFRPRGEALPRRVRLFGEMGDWINPIPMTRGPGPDGAFEAALVLPVGVYAYKFVVDGAWLADPENPRTRSTGGNQNSVLSVGGAGEPFLHAPASPYVAELDGGGLRITAALRRGTPGSPHVRWTEGDGEPTRETAMAAAVEEDEHVVYQVTLPLSARRLAYRLVVHAPGSPSVVEPPMDEAPFAYHRPVGRRRVPPWWRDAVLYTVYVDRFRPARDRAGWERDPGRGRAAGGHLEGVRRSLRELRELGITVLYLTPIHVASSSHRYDFVDPLAVDPALGGEAAFRALVEDAHTLELRIVLDLSFSHAGLAFPPCQDVMARGRDSAYASWFRWSDDGPERSRLLHYGRRLDAPLLDLEHPDVQALVLQAVDNWASFGIDGLRLDMAAEVPLPLARRIRARLLARRPDAVVFGELVPAHAWRWATNDALDAATDFGFHGVVTDFVARRAISAGEAVARLRATDLVRGGASATHVRFVSSHDHARLATVAAHAGAPERAALGLVLLFTMPGVPALLYGEEIGLRAPRLEELREDAWADRMPMRWEGGGGERGEGRDLALRNVVQRLIGARRGSTALREGTLEILHAGDEVLVFRRTSGDVVDTYVNVGDTALELEIGDDEQPVLDPIVTVGGPSVDGETVRLPPRSALVARRLDSPARRPQHNLLVRDRDFERARPVTRATPTRMDFALTERCNLRCAHCITHAPERTAGGTARTMTPHVLDRLRPWLGEASYFGFVHGGESLTAPIFFDVLEAIRAARAGAPYVAHLLSNGVLLTGATLLRLAALGVNSISVSLDGATAETNDAIREGGRFAAIVQRVREAVAVRRSASLDLRLGLSFVALAQNVHEVGGMVELAADVGVDWLKIEEGVPANAFAERSLVGLGREELGAALEAARKRAKALGLVLVDHTVERVIWRCTLNENPDAAAFVAADEYANRSEIHPCRAPWEVACIEPNGDVRLGHFFGPILGNVSTGSLDDVWNSPVARDARAASHAARLCGLSGPVACLRR